MSQGIYQCEVGVGGSLDTQESAPQVMYIIIGIYSMLLFVVFSRLPSMFTSLQELNRRSVLTPIRLTLWSPLVRTLLLFFILVGSSAAAEEAQNAAAAVSVGQQLAISDFDGDLHLDLAIVQAGATASGSTDYWIRLQLSAIGRQSIRIVAPAGGLLIEARDVNGDHAVDLILSTLLSEPVAVFLNDGHGAFSRVAPAAFPGAFGNSLTNWASVSDHVKDAVAAPPQLRPGIFQVANALTNIKTHTDVTPPSGGGFALDSFLASQAGRAPPA